MIDMVEAKAPEEYLSALLRLLYGANLSELRDPSARDHARVVIRTTRSDRVAGQLTAAGAVDPLVVEAGIQRLLDGPPPPNHPPRQVRRFRLPRRQARALAGVAAAALLGVAFLLGSVVNRPGTVDREASTPTKDVTPVITQQVVPTFQFQVADDPEQTGSGSVFSFVERGAERFPQHSCGKVDAVWICPVPLTSITAGGSLIALPVTNEELKFAEDASAKKKPMVIDRDPLPLPE
jgi:hypothetical protein